MVSPAGELYLGACEMAGVDPAEPLLADDVLAHGFRLAATWYRGWRLSQITEDKDSNVTDMVDRARAKGAEIRRLIGG